MVRLHRWAHPKRDLTACGRPRRLFPRRGAGEASPKPEGFRLIGCGDEVRCGRAGGRRRPQARRPGQGDDRGRGRVSPRPGPRRDPRGTGRSSSSGPRRPTSAVVRWTSESPPGGGPLRATVAGLELVRSDVVVVLAVDYPFVTRAVVAELIRAVGTHDGAALQDEGGAMHYVVGAYRTDALRSALEAHPPVRHRCDPCSELSTSPPCARIVRLWTSTHPRTSRERARLSSEVD